MADFSKEDLKQAFIEALQSSGRSVDNKDLDKMIANLAKLDKQIASGTPTVGGFFKSLLTGKNTIVDLTDQLKTLDEQIEELTDSADENAIAQRQELIQRKTAIQRLNEQNIAHKVAIDGITSLGKAVSGIAGVAGRTMGGLVRGIQDGSSAFSLAGGLMSGAIDGMNTGVQAAAGGMGAIGQTMMMSTNPRLKMLGIAATVASTAISGFGNLMAGAGKAVVEMMVKEMEKAVKSYQSLTAAGAMFSNGMTGMYQSAMNAHLTVNQLSEVVSKSAANLADSGMGVGQAVIMMGRVGKAMRDAKIDTSLLKLGYSFQEQAELSAEVMADMRRANSTLLKDPAGIARATEQYATNLRVIASITGEDARKKMEEARQAGSNVAFRAKLMDLEKQHPGIYQKTMTAMAAMTPQMQQNVREHVLFGQTINETGAVIEASSEGYSKAVNGTADAILDGTLDVQKNQKLLGESYDKFRTELDKFSGIGLAGAAGQLNELNGALSREVLASDSRTKEGIEAAQKAAKEQKAASDQLTQGYVAAAKGAQDLALQLQDKILPVLGKFALFSGMIVNELAKQLAALKGLDPSDAGPGFFDELWENMKTYVPTGAMMGGAMAAPGGVTAVAGAGIGAAVGVGGALVQTGIDRWNRPSYKPNQTGPDDPKKYQGLNVGGRWQGEAIEGGPADDQLIALAKKVQALYPQGKFNAFNDTFHHGGAHAAGKAIDFNLGFTPNDEQGKKIIAQFKDLGFHTVLDEYNHPSEGATGGHIHAALAKGGITSGPSLAGEAGPEAVIPLPDGRTVPVRMDGLGELIEKFDEMIRLMRDQLDVSEQHLRADT